MDILVIGGTGMIGSRVVAEAVSRGHSVTATSRAPKGDKGASGEALVALDIGDAARLGQLAAAADVTIAAVSPRSTGDAEAEAVAYGEALIAGIGEARLLLVGGAGSLNLPDGTPVAEVVPEAYAAEARGMRQAFEALHESALDATVLAPAGLIEPGERTGTFRLGGRTLLMDENGDSRISAEDYAVAMLDEVEEPKHRGEIFTVAY